MVWPLFHRHPQKIGPYEILTRIGKGGGGSVFKARHDETGNLVALKVLCARDARDTLSLQRFEQEFFASRILNNPHIVPGLDFGRDGGLVYLVMEFVDGLSLSDHLKARGHLPENEALGIITQVGRALHQAHERGLIHRDVKPSNILLATDGRARLTDFGVVKCLGRRLDLTATAMCLGTPAFMAPEQFHDAKRVDQRCDVYGLAATLYKTVTGKMPFQARGYLSMVRKKLNGHIIPPRQLVAGMSLRVDWAMLRALSVSPALRPASCAAFIRDLTGMDISLVPSHPELPEKATPGNTSSPPRSCEERRAAIRYPCALDGFCLPLNVKGQQPWAGQVRNISGSGLCLVLGRRFESGTLLRLGWRQAKEEAPATVMARVVRTEAQGSSKWILCCQLAQRLGDDEVFALLGSFPALKGHGPR